MREAPPSHRPLLSGRPIPLKGGGDMDVPLATSPSPLKGARAAKRIEGVGVTFGFSRVYAAASPACMPSRMNCTARAASTMPSTPPTTLVPVMPRRATTRWDACKAARVTLAWTMRARMQGLSVPDLAQGRALEEPARRHADDEPPKGGADVEDGDARDGDEESGERAQGQFAAEGRRERALQHAHHGEPAEHADEGPGQRQAQLGGERRQKTETQHQEAVEDAGGEALLLAPARAHDRIGRSRDAGRDGADEPGEDAADAGNEGEHIDGRLIAGEGEDGAALRILDADHGHREGD